MATRFACIRVRGLTPEVAGCVVAEAHAAGASGVEERAEAAGRITLLLYAPAAGAAAVRRAALATLHRGDERVEVDAAQPVPDADWTSRWRDGLEPVVVSSRLVVRPDFVHHDPRPGQATLRIDPGQAFGTGAHASTSLALEAIDRVAPSLPPGARVLDVGCGSGVLALAALALSGARAVALDVDPLAARIAAANARRNGLAERLSAFAGTLDALSDATERARFDLVVANLLRSELVPILPAVAARVRAGGVAVLSGVLAPERDLMEPAIGAAGLCDAERLGSTDAAGDAWIAWITRR